MFFFSGSIDNSSLLSQVKIWYKKYITSYLSALNYTTALDSNENVQQICYSTKCYKGIGVKRPIIIPTRGPLILAASPYILFIWLFSATL